MRTPNILFILIDDLGWKDLACTGSEYYRTPNIDRLAAEGMRFTNAYSSSPVCAPSRGAIVSGKNPARTKFTTVFDGPAADDDSLFEVSKYRGGHNQFLEAFHRHNLPRSETLCAEVLAEAGYTTGFFGKWHCGSSEGYTPDVRGFHVAKGFRNGNIPTGASKHWGKSFARYSVNMPVTDDDYISENLTAECEAFVRDNRDRPFFAFLSHYLVHFPLEPKPDKLEKWKSVPTTDQNSPAYAAMVESVDESVGRLMEVLDELELVDNTLVVFTSDNGGFSPRATSNYPLLGGKAFPFEAGMKVPFLVRWPVAVSPGRVSDLRTIAMDIYPTFLEVAGVPLRPEQHADGMSLVPILREEGRTPDRPLVFHYPHYTGYSSPYSAIIENDWKLIHFYNDEAGAYLLFDLSQDPWELHDLVATEPARVESLNAKLESILDEMGAERPVKNPDYDPKWPERQNRDTSYQKALKHRRKIEERIKL